MAPILLFLICLLFGGCDSSIHSPALASWARLPSTSLTGGKHKLHFVTAIKSDSEFDFKVQRSLKTKKLVVVDFAAKWCPPCQKISPRFDSLATSNKYPHVKFLKVDVDDVPEVATRYKIRSMPTFVFIGKNGQEVSRFSGANVDQICETIEKYSKDIKR